ncbi:MAG: ATP-binding cassette domain-containing protein [Clostridia bacterium]|nr:ATP-binding cassette domain-containing protein [Clostridia bacterium]
MLEIKEIRKVYELGKPGNENYQKVNALNGVSVNFRKSEFVAILGQSGCGKTTLLNIIGGLDRYTSGDLVIDGKSTKDYSDKDWDTYRNKKIGFVFQSYNLIPHLNVFENVELALTLSGIKKADRKQKVIDSLTAVGLGDKIYAKPNQLSGGQMQRVAIARALINDPEIILADEPTGALDSKTSVQVMDILKEISKDKLIIMVTHNPELAETYASRTIRLLDGDIVEDTDPYEMTDKEVDTSTTSKKKMSFWTALSLSFKNLLTKKARTLLVSIAGSIGIIGIALILSLSTGFQAYVNSVQEDTLSSYPLTIEAVSVDYSAMLGAFMGSSSEDAEVEEGVVHKNDVIVDMFKNFLSGSKQNNLEAFKVWLDDNDKIQDLTTGIQYTYNFNLNIYDNANSVQLSPSSLFYNGAMVWLDIQIGQYVFPSFESQYKSANGLDASYVLTEPEVKAIKGSEAYHLAMLNTFNTQFMGGNGSTMVSTVMGLKNSRLTNFVEMIDNTQLLNSQYEVMAVADGLSKNSLFSNLEAKDIVLVLDEKGNLSDYSLYTLGIKTTPTIEDIAGGLAQDPKDYEIPTDDGYAYETLIGKKYKILLDTDYYKQIGGVYVDIRTALDDKTISQAEYDAFVSEMLADVNTGLVLEVKGIVKPAKNVTATSIDGDIAYTHALTELVIEKIRSAISANNQIPETLNVDLAKPTSINIYCNDFDAKKQVEALIAEYNAEVLADPTKGEDYEITYTDYVGVLMSSVSTIINAITYVLIAFVSVSLIVSSIMIGIITYISVLERIKEIGILRSIGASKRDIKRVFTAESLIIGFSAGALGIIITLLLCIPINIIISSLAGLSAVATLPIVGAVVLVALSMLLTFIAGLIPARIASKKDPVIALRTE